MIKFSEGQYYYNDIRVRSANTAMDTNGNKHWKLFLENGEHAYAYGGEAAILQSTFSAKHCKSMEALYRSKEAIWELTLRSLSRM